MELRRSPSGVLILGPTTGSRAAAALLVLVFAALIAAWVWTQREGDRQFSPRQWALIALVALILFGLMGGLSFLRTALGAQVAFDGRKRMVTRYGRRLCGYGDVEELRIVVRRGRNQAYQEMVSYRLQLVLRSGALRWIGEDLGGEDTVNSVAHRIAAELGVGVRVLG